MPLHRDVRTRRSYGGATGRSTISFYRYCAVSEARDYSCCAYGFNPQKISLDKLEEVGRSEWSTWEELLPKGSRKVDSSDLSFKP